MSVANELLQELSNAPNGLERPVAAVATLAAAGMAMVAADWQHRVSRDKYTQPFPNPAGEQAVTDIRGGIDTKQSRRRRIAPVLGGIAGIGIAVSALVANPTYDNPHSDTGANEVVVIDASNSMLRTTDMGGNESRYESVLKGINGVDGYKGNLGAIVTGSGDELAIPLSRNWKKNVSALNNPSVNPNGGNLAKSIKLAGDQLPLETTKDGKHTRKGEVIVISDGASAGDAADITSAIKAVEKSGASTKVIVTGTTDASYKIGGSESYGSGVQPQIFAGLGEKDVMRAANSKEVASELNSVIAKANTVHEQKPWRVPLGAGLALLAGSVALGGYRSIKRF